MCKTGIITDANNTNDAGENGSPWRIPACGIHNTSGTTTPWMQNATSDCSSYVPKETIPIGNPIS